MKTKHIKYILAAGLVCCGLSATMTSCSDVLDEQPRSQFDPTFFTTKAGIEGGLTSLYAHLRYFYGNGYYLNSLETGTDEYTYAQSADGNFKDADLSGVGSMTPNNSIAGGCWGTAFANINTASGIIENGAEAGMDASLLAEAYFFRAFDYFILVQTYGGVPLDLGAGELKFNTSTVRTSVRNTVPEVYAAIFSDLEKAVADLPENPRLTGTATKNLARLYLAKAYLTYAWWLENPNNIPTYPECSRDKGQANSYFQKAYDMAKAIGDEGAEIVKNCSENIPKLYNSLATDLIKDTKYDEAIAQLEKAVAAAKEFGADDALANAQKLLPQAQLLKGNALLTAKDYEGAAEVYKAITDADPANGMAALRLGMALNQLGKADDAIAALKAAAENRRERKCFQDCGNRSQQPFKES